MVLWPLDPDESHGNLDEDDSTARDKLMTWIDGLVVNVDQMHRRVR